MAFVGCARKKTASSVRSALVGRRESMMEVLLLRRRGYVSRINWE